jgi:D-sedoheptulose 7-phosphate isomerase
VLTNKDVVNYMFPFNSGATDAPPKLQEIFQTAASTADYVRQAAQRTAELVASLDAERIAAAIEVIAEAGRRGRSIYLIANGGSAAVASHFVNDMGVNTWMSGQPGFRVFCLADNTATVTALANDLSYEDVFARQLQCALAPGDVVIAMSVSGNSPNILRGIEAANAAGAITIAFCGFDGGKLAAGADYTVHIPATRDEYGPVEDAFGVIAHIISGYLSMSRGRALYR